MAAREQASFTGIISGGDPEYAANDPSLAQNTSAPVFQSAYGPRFSVFDALTISF
jgi:hypothetical protein